MNKIKFLITLLLIVPYYLIAQNVGLTVSPEKTTIIAGSQAEFNLHLNVGEFNKQLFLKILSSDLPAFVDFRFSKTSVAAPYSDLTLIVSGFENLNAGTYKIIVNAYNDPLSATDTCYVVYTGSACQWINVSNPQYLYKHKFIFDKNDNKWFVSFNYLTMESPEGEISTIEAFDIDIEELYCDPANTIWGISSKGLFQVKDGKIRLIENPELPVDKIYGLEFLNNSVWIATGKGIYEFDGTFWTVYDSSNTSLPLHTVRKIRKDKKGNLWFGLVGNNKENRTDLLYYFNGSTFNNFSLFASDSIYYAEGISDFDFDKNNNLWYFSPGSNYPVVRISDTAKAAWGKASTKIPGFIWKKLKGDTIAIDSTPVIRNDFQNPVFSSSSSGEIWILNYIPGVGSEICRFIDTNLTIYSPGNSGIFKGNFYGINEDSENKMWVNGTSGLFFKPELAYFTCEGQIVTSRSDFNTTDQLVAYPNPTSQNVTLDLQSFSGQVVKVIIKNQTGVSLSVLTPESEKNKITIDLNGYPEGIYFLEVTGTEKSVVKKIIKID